VLLSIAATTFSHAGGLPAALGRDFLTDAEISTPLSVADEELFKEIMQDNGGQDYDSSISSSEDEGDCDLPSDLEASVTEIEEAWNSDSKHEGRKIDKGKRKIDEDIKAVEAGWNAEARRLQTLQESLKNQNKREELFLERLSSFFKKVSDRQVALQEKKEGVKKRQKRFVLLKRRCVLFSSGVATVLLYAFAKMYAQKKVRHKQRELALCASLIQGSDAKERTALLARHKDIYRAYLGFSCLYYSACALSFTSLASFLLYGGYCIKKPLQK